MKKVTQGPIQWGILLVAVLMIFTTWRSAQGQDLIKVKTGRLTFPSATTVIFDVVKHQGLDRRHNIDLQPVSYGAVSAYYAAYATGELDIGGGGPLVLQKMRNEGVPIKALLTLVRLSSLAVITADPAIRTIHDLRGKTIAADMGSSEYSILAAYGVSQGVVFGKDVTVVQAGPPLARAQLKANRVAAAMIWEPTATFALRDDPRYRIVFNGDTAWRAVAKTGGWQLLIFAREDFLRRHPRAVPRLVGMLQDTERFIRTRPEEADRIVTGTLSLPPGAIKEAVTSGRLVYEVLPAWEDERSVLWGMFKVAVDQGYLDKLPDEGVIYKPHP